MNKVIVLTSITYALKAQELLRANGINANLTRSPSVRKVRGCGYGVKFAEENEKRASELIEQSGIPTLGSVDDK